MERRAPSTGPWEGRDGASGSLHSAVRGPRWSDGLPPQEPGRAPIERRAPHAALSEGGDAANRCVYGTVVSAVYTVRTTPERGSRPVRTVTR